MQRDAMFCYQLLIVSGLAYKLEEFLLVGAVGVLDFGLYAVLGAVDVGNIHFQEYGNGGGGKSGCIENYQCKVLDID